MGTLTNAEIADKYNVATSTVSRWMKMAELKKNNLQIVKSSKKTLVVDNPHNHAELARLKEEGKINRSNIYQAEVEPDPKFYEIFNDDEIIEIVKDLELKSEIDFKYTYKGEGAYLWDRLYQQGVNSGSYATATRVVNLLHNSLDLILQRVGEDELINIIDIGPGNSYPVKDFLSELIKLEKINKYIIVDISQEMLDISKNYFQEWFPQLKFAAYLKDVEKESLERIFYENTIDQKTDKKVINVILNIGGTIGNHDNIFYVLNNIRNGMIKKDIFLMSNNFDLPQNRNVFSKSAAEICLWIPKLLGLAVDKEQIVGRFDEVKNCKIRTIELDKDYMLNIRVLGSVKRIELFKGEKISISKHHMSEFNKLFEQLETCGLRLTALNTETDYTHFLAICEAMS